MVSLHIILCITCLLLGYIIGNITGWLQYRSKDKPREDIPVWVEVVNRIYYDEDSDEYVEEVEEYKHNCADLHRPHHRHRVTNFVGRGKRKRKKEKDE